MRLRDETRSGSAQQALERARAAREQVLTGASLVLSVTRIEGPEVRVLGRFSDEEGLRRETGGPPWVLREGTHFARIALAHPSVLMPTPDDKILNRNVRPLLAALRKCVPLVMYGGRDFVSAEGEILALLAWARGAAGEVVIDVALATEASVLEEPEPPEVARAHLEKRVRPFSAPHLPSLIALAYAEDGAPVVLEERPLAVVTPAGRRLAGSEVAIGRVSLHEGPRGELDLRGDFFADDRLPEVLCTLRTQAGPRAETLERWVREPPVVVEGIRDWPRVLAQLCAAAR